MGQHFGIIDTQHIDLGQGLDGNPIFGIIMRLNWN